MAFITRESNPNEAITVSQNNGVFIENYDFLSFGKPVSIYRRPLKSHAQMFGVRECCTKKLFQTIYAVEYCNETSVKTSTNFKMCSTIALTVQTKLFILPLPCEWNVRHFVLRNSLSPSVIFITRLLTCVHSLASHVLTLRSYKNSNTRYKKSSYASHYSSPLKLNFHVEFAFLFICFLNCLFLNIRHFHAY